MPKYTIFQIKNIPSGNTETVKFSQKLDFSSTIFNNWKVIKFGFLTIFDTNNNIFVNKTTIFSVPTQQWSTISILWEKVKTRGIWSLFSILAWFTIWFEVSNVKPMKEIQREMFVLVQEIAGYYIYIWLGFTGSERGVLKANILSHRQSKQQQGKI